MAIGDYTKTLLRNGYGPPYRNATYHNKQENKIYDIDQATAALQAATTAANLLAAVRTQDSLFQGRLWVAGRQYLAGDLVYHAADGLIYLCLANTSTVEPDYTNAGIEGVTWKKLVWTTESDGNGGQPPAPKPRTGTDIGQFRFLTGSNGSTLSLPAGGSWCWFGMYFTTAVPYTVLATAATGASIAAGGSQIMSSSLNNTPFAIIWRIA